MFATLPLADCSLTERGRPADLAASSAMRPYRDPSERPAVPNRIVPPVRGERTGQDSQGQADRNAVKLTENQPARSPAAINRSTAAFPGTVLSAFPGRRHIRRGRDGRQSADESAGCPPAEP